MGIDKIFESEDGEMTPEARELAEQVFRITAPITPQVLEVLQELDQTINAGIFILWREDGTLAAVTGNTPPSNFLPILKKVIEKMESTTGQQFEAAYADDKGRAN